MPRKMATEENGLSIAEKHNVQSFLISFQSGNCTKEQTISRILEVLSAHQKMNVTIWEDIKDTVEFAGFNWAEASQFVRYIKEAYRKSKYKN